MIVNQLILQNIYANLHIQYNKMEESLRLTCLSKKLPLEPLKQCNSLLLPVNYKINELSAKMKSQFKRQRETSQKVFISDIEQLHKEVKQLQRMIADPNSQKDADKQKTTLIHQKNKLIEDIQKLNTSIRNYKKQSSKCTILKDELERQIQQNQYILNPNISMNISSVHKGLIGCVESELISSEEIIEEDQTATFEKVISPSPDQPSNLKFSIFRSLSNEESSFAEQSLILPKIHHKQVIQAQPKEQQISKHYQSLCVNTNANSTISLALDLELSYRAQQKQTKLQAQTVKWQKIQSLLAKAKSLKCTKLSSLILNIVKEENNNEIKSIFKNFQISVHFQEYLKRKDVKKQMAELMEILVK